VAAYHHPLWRSDISHRLGMAGWRTVQAREQHKAKTGQTSATISSPGERRGGGRPMERGVGPADFGPPFEEEPGCAVLLLSLLSLLASLGGPRARRWQIPPRHASARRLAQALKQALDKHRSTSQPSSGSARPLLSFGGKTDSDWPPPRRPWLRLARPYRCPQRWLFMFAIALAAASILPAVAEGFRYAPPATGSDKFQIDSLRGAGECCRGVIWMMIGLPPPFSSVQRSPRFLGLQQSTLWLPLHVWCSAFFLAFFLAHISRLAWGRIRFKSTDHRDVKCHQIGP
jgi:hypothetical protein